MADSPLQKAPLGLLGAFNLKTLGQNPALFGEAVFGMADVLDMYTADLTQTVTASANVTVAGNSVTITVPQGEVWRVRHIAGFIAIGVGTQGADGIAFTLGINAVGITQIADPKTTAYAAAAVIHAAAWLDRGTILRPGDLLTLTNAKLLSVASAATLRARVEVFPI